MAAPSFPAHQIEMPLLKLSKASLNFGTHVLLDSVDFQIRKGERIGLLGRNGAGKTTLMKVIAGLVQPESGERWLRPETRVAWLEQSLPDGNDKSVYDTVAEGLAEIGQLLSQYHALAANYQPANATRMEQVQNALEAKQGWALGQKVDTVISQLQLPADTPVAELSGGWRKRVALARALVSEPQLLLLDEPTNHLDIPAIEWLEEQLQHYSGALLLVTHDRSFLGNVVNRIAEIDRGKLAIFEGSYQRFLRFREEQLAAEETANRLFDKKLAEEERWIRQGIKARRTRNEGRVRALEELRRERSQRRERMGKASFASNQGGISGKLVAELDDVTHSFGDNTVIRNFSTTVMRGDRIGLVGLNGAGKSTLLKILLGELAPTSGNVKLGTNLQIAYFDQLRTELDPEMDLIDNICGGQEFIEIDGKRKHAISYLGEFLFTPDRVRSPAKVLSGGEQNRAILAKLFTRPANILVLDEPTNDLDIETLELLEEILLKFSGTVLLVSHDRQFMDNAVTSLMVFEGDGRILEVAGGYSDWVNSGGSLLPRQEQVIKTNARKAAPGRPSNSATVKAGQESRARKLSYKESRELEQQLQLIDQLEAKQKTLEAEISDPGFYVNHRQRVETTLKDLADTQAALESAFRRWEELESRRQG